MEISSQLLSRAVEEVSLLPGIGKRTALRLMLHLLRQPEGRTDALAEALLQMRNQIQRCRQCHNISDSETCEICSNPRRESALICVVEDIRDVMAIEATGHYRGLYHVLGGKISPVDGVGPQDLTILPLVERVRSGEVDELIFALSATMEGDTTNFYIYRQLEGLPVTLSTIARGIPVGDDLEYADQVTLGRSIIQRIPFEGSLNRENR